MKTIVNKTNYPINQGQELNQEKLILKPKPLQY